MKQLLSLFLFLLPCLAWAQYPSNGNQKITLGEQTTADGLIFRGVAATDTVRKPSIDTMAYMVLDTTTNIMWHYKKATSNAWLRVGGSITSGLTGVLPVANGGTGSATQNFVDLTNTQTVGGAKTFSNTVTFNGNFSLGLDLIFNIASRSIVFNSTNTLLWENSGSLNLRTGGIDRLTIASTGAATFSSLAGINDVGADANGKLQAATSDINLKNTIENSPFGLNEILLLNPVTFLYNDANRKIDSDVKEVGFIAQDVFDIIPNAVSSTGIGYLQLDYRAITATLVKAIQEQNAIIKALEQRIINLENK
jgi:hypothetical protein